MLGYLGGAIQTVNSATGLLSNTSLFLNRGPSPTSVTIKTSAVANKVLAFMSADQVNGVGAEFDLSFGDDDPAFDGVSTVGLSAFIDDFAFGALALGRGINFLGGDPAAVPTELDVALVTADVGGLERSSAVPAGVTLCACDFLTWGFLDGHVLHGPDLGVIHLANWVAGEVSNVAAINALGAGANATYSGHAIATVVTGPNVYTAIGGFSMNVAFNNRATTILAVSNLDGADYAGLGLVNIDTGVNAGNNVFDAVLNGDFGRRIDMRGSFIGGAGDPAAEWGAQIVITAGADYKGSGIAAASK